MSPSSRSPRILVVGSVNMDVVIRTPRFPRGGETVLGESLRLFPGGKGANQAVAVARLGGRAVFVGRVGSDPWGEELLSKLRENGVDTRFVVVDPDHPTGNATIAVDDDGENRIILIEGANEAVDPVHVDAAFDCADRFDAVLTQLELPLATVLHTIRRGRKAGLPVILDAGPPQDVTPEELRGVTILSPNETETEALTGITVVDEESAGAAARRLGAASGAEHVVLKLGARGALIPDRESHRVLPGHAVDAVDTTAAGDSFTAALAVEYMRGVELVEAVTRANAAGALAVTRPGAQPSIPTSQEVDAFLARRR